MKKIMQTTSENCMAACLASYFGCDIDAVPDEPEPNWQKPIREWVKTLGFGYVTIAVPNEEIFKGSFSDGYLIVSGQSTRSRHHAVIYKDGQLWHDPHPDSTGIKRVEQVDFFYPLEPPERI